MTPPADKTQQSLPVVDVRNVIPRDRHPYIFGTFDALAVGDAFILINDHDPKPLYYQFLHERTDQYDWAYLEEGPERWQVRIARAQPGADS